MIALGKEGGWNGHRDFLDHQITSWGPILNLTMLGSKLGAKLVKTNIVIGFLHELLQEVMYCYKRPCFATGGVPRAFLLGPYITSISLIVISVTPLLLLLYPCNPHFVISVPLNYYC